MRFTILALLFLAASPAHASYICDYLGPPEQGEGSKHQAFAKARGFDRSISLSLLNAVIRARQQCHFDPRRFLYVASPRMRAKAKIDGYTIFSGDDDHYLGGYKFAIPIAEKAYRENERIAHRYYRVVGMGKATKANGFPAEIPILEPVE